ncbi:glycosyltransferase [Parapusillimonas sp. SGNA-6]|nr:glycosyltransferase [Parapusillimonas sp. SGNA-6]
MKVSIITVCYNSAETIRDTIESVLNQTYGDIEYIIIDGASTDGTLAIIGEYKNRIDKIRSEPDRGLYDAMNKGIALATGDFVGILNSDDIFSTEFCIESVVAFLKANPQLDGCYADLVFVKRNNTEIVTRKYSSRIFSPKRIRFGIMCPHPTFYARRQWFEQAGSFDTEFPVAADFELITRFIVRGARFGRLGLILVKMREGGVSTSGFISIIRQNLELVRACRKNGIYTNILMIAMKIPYKVLGYLSVSKDS